MELALRQHDRLAERVEVQPEHLVEHAIALADASPLTRRHPCVDIEALERRGLGRPTPEPARDAISPLAIDGELEQDASFDRPERHEVRCALPATEARNLPVKGEHHRVKDARLTGTGRAGDDEQVKWFEVDLLAIAEGGEALDGETKRPHT